jgi:hypothetical protein
MRQNGPPRKCEERRVRGISFCWLSRAGGLKEAPAAGRGEAKPGLPVSG